MKQFCKVPLMNGFSRFAIVILSALLTVVTGRQAFAAVAWNHLWNYSTFYVITTSAGSMAGALSGAATNYDVSTDLNYASSGPIAGNENFYGYFGWQGLTQPFNSSAQSCIIWPSAATNGNCNTTTKKAFSANVYFNTAYLPYTNNDWLARHEMGHVFGLNHPLCSDPASVMKVPSCGAPPTTLQADEITWINIKY